MQHHRSTVLQVSPKLGRAHYCRGLEIISKWAKASTINDRHLHLCVALAKQLALYGGTPDDLQLPDKLRIMQPKRDLYYVEAETRDWLSLESTPETAQMIHPDIEEQIAERLGVPSLRQVMQVGLPGMCVGERKCLLYNELLVSRTSSHHLAIIVNLSLLCAQI